MRFQETAPWSLHRPLGAGQFCTNPGLLLALDQPSLENFVTSAVTALRESSAQTMLSPAIHNAYQHSTVCIAHNKHVETLAQGIGSDDPNTCRAVLYATNATAFLADPNLHEEMFGAASLLVRCRDEQELLRVLHHLEGQLTATLHFTDADLPLARKLLPVLERKAGRILANGWPTGVEVCHAMVHGGPYPATSDARGSSVGTLSINRFLRPVCFQNYPDNLLPDALKNVNPLGILRLIDGVSTNKVLGI